MSIGAKISKRPLGLLRPGERLIQIFAPGREVTCPGCLVRYLFEATDPTDGLCPSCRPRGETGEVEIDGVTYRLPGSGTGVKPPPPTSIPSDGRPVES